MMATTVPSLCCTAVVVAATTAIITTTTTIVDARCRAKTFNRRSTAELKNLSLTLVFLRCAFIFVFLRNKATSHCILIVLRMAGEEKILRVRVNRMDPLLDFVRNFATDNCDTIAKNTFVKTRII